ncbi:MAG: gluconate 2-dehydrogenase subunit 3 family protein [Thiovulaceae bacterium]|nr:gluconate 2-dehydrogenase subunit 3 family protein [Sulfurimonadaceae bacterium]MCW9026854.1 gluconate 2-dehydrogenase subunit 3 family protein [Sulfurimonadaceae bacterium]
MINRRKFLKAGFLSSVIFISSGCELFSVTTPKETLAILQNDLFPHSKKMGTDVKKYMQIVLKHSKVSDADKKFIKNGIKWLNEEAVLLFDSTYVKLPSDKRQEVLKSISKVKWGRSFIYDNLTYIMEANFSDPIYGVADGQGWKWLDFNTGLPQPKKAYL